MKTPLLVLLSLCLLAPTPAARQAAPLGDRVDAIVKSELLALGIPSVAVAVMRDGKIVFDRAWGVADIEKKSPASSTSTYPIGSLNKQFTAALVLKQVDRGRIAVTDPIGKHLPGLSSEAGALPIWQLLNHTSGLKRSVTDRETRSQKVSSEALLAAALEGKLESTPGTKFTYSNAGYTVLGVLVENLYGKSYAAVLQDEIAVPLQLTTLSMCGEPKAGQTTGYTRAQTGRPAPPPGQGMHHSHELGASGICATAADLVKWTHALHTGRVLSDASYKAMTTPRGAAAPDYGFGLSIKRSAWGAPVTTHDAQSLTGHAGDLHWYPEHSLAVALLYSAYPRVPEAADLVPRLVLGVPLPVPAAPAADAPPVERSKLIGVYELMPQRTFEVTLEGGELYVTPPGGDSRQPLVHRWGNSYWLGTRDSTTVLTFFIVDGAPTAFEANANGIKRTLKKIK